MISDRVTALREPGIRSLICSTQLDGKYNKFTRGGVFFAPPHTPLHFLNVVGNILHNSGDFVNVIFSSYL